MLSEKNECFSFRQQMIPKGTNGALPIQKYNYSYCVILNNTLFNKSATKPAKKCQKHEKAKLQGTYC